MTAHNVLLKGRDEIADRTMAFHFQKPARFSFKPGQAIDLVLGGRPSADPASARHAFSLVSAPSEDVITIATRIRSSAFKNALAAMPVGSTAGLDGPFGSLTLHSSRSRPAVFIAGGIGITPFMSILRQAARDRLPQRFILIYSNHRPEDAAFLAELQELERNYRHFRLVPMMTRSNGAGRIDGHLIGKIKKEAAAAIYYVTGSPLMVAGLRQLLANAAVSDDDVRSEEFFGY